MDLPISLASAIFERKGLYYFRSEKLSSQEPHYFIIIEFEGKIVHLVVCASDFEKCKFRIEKRKQDPCTLVRVKANSENGLKNNSYVDCNNVFNHYTLEILEEKLSEGILSFKGLISDEDYLQLLTGIIASNDVDRGVISLIKNTLGVFNA